MGAQIATWLYDATKIHEDDILFQSLLVFIEKTPYHDVRKSVVKMLKVPQYFKKQESEMKELITVQRKFLASTLGHLLIDNQNTVRSQAFSKFIEFGIKIEDIPSDKKKMIIVKEGMSDSDLNIRNICLKFLVPSFVSYEDVEISQDQLKKIIESNKSQEEGNLTFVRSRRQSQDS